MKSITIAGTAQSAIEAIALGDEITQVVLGKVATYMDAAESLKNSTLTGPEKLAWVLDYVKNEVIEISARIDKWLPKIIEFISKAKAAFNLWKDLLKLI